MTASTRPAAEAPSDGTGALGPALAFLGSAFAKGMPVGLQLVAPFHREDLILQAAHAYQESVDWESVYPGLAKQG